MKLDFHTHGKLNKKLPFSTKYTDLLFKKAYERGVDAICLTEHFNTLEFDTMYKYIKDKYQQDGDCVRTKEGVLIFFGMEVDIKESGHTLVIGKYEDIIDMYYKFEPNNQKSNFLCFDEVVKIVRQYDVLFGAAHAFRDRSNIPDLSMHQLQCFDFFDLNGKDLSFDIEKTKDEVYGLAKKVHKPVVAGSDTHQSTQYGCVITNFKRDFNTLEQLKKEIIEGDYNIELADSIKIQVEDATLQKALLKEVHRLGGDYVEFL